MQKLNRAAEFAQAHPVHARGGLFDRRRCFLANGNHSHFDAAASRTFQNEKRKIAITGNQSPALGLVRPRTLKPLRNCVRWHSYLVRPRSAVDSINRIRVWTSSDAERVPRICSRAWVVLSLERRSRR